MDVGKVLARVLVERRAPHLLEHLAHHHRDAEQLAGLLDGNFALRVLRGSAVLIGNGLIGDGLIGNGRRVRGIHPPHSVGCDDPEQTAEKARTGHMSKRARSDHPD